MSRRHDEEIIQAALDGSLDGEAFAVLETRLAAEPELRRLFRSYSRMQHVLEEKYAPQAAANPAPIPRKSRPLRPLAIAATILALGTAAFLLKPPAAGTTVEFGPESRGRIIHLQGAGGDQLRAGSLLELDHGSASVRGPSGLLAHFEGPGILEYAGRNAFHLHQGRAWFKAGPKDHGTVFRTDDLQVESPGGEFGLIAGRGRDQQLHVLEGEVRLLAGGVSQGSIPAGDGARWSGSALVRDRPPATFATAFPQPVLAFAERFQATRPTPLHGKLPAHGPGPWEVRIGGPLIEDGILDTSGNLRHVAYAPLGGPPLDELSHIMLLTLTTEDPDSSRFHSDGWAGVSLFTGDQERIFVGDPNGPEKGWALHPVGYEARHACPLLDGKSTVTLRYDFRSGLAQLFEGTGTSGPALASEWITPGLTFDRIRIANGSHNDGAIDAGVDPATLSDEESLNVRGDVALREIRVTVLSADPERNTLQP